MPSPVAVDDSEWLSKWKTLGRKETRRNRLDYHKPLTDDPFANKRNSGRFVMLDGEGVTHIPHMPQSYVAMGASTGDEISGYELSTEQCLKFLIDVKARNGNNIYCAFAFKYDVSMILKDLPVDLIKRVMSCKITRWRQYRIEYITLKTFYVKDMTRDISITVYDVFTFFGGSLIKACQDYLGENDPALAEVAEGKAARGEFEYAELDSFILPYMRKELQLAVRLADKLREAFHLADIIPQQWSGPGSVAATVLRKHKIKDTYGDRPDDVLTASQYAYAGGHFEQYYTGLYTDKVYAYDIRSAYPYAATHLPNLSKGEWVYHTDGVIPDSPFTVLHIRYYAAHCSSTPLTMAYPIPMRDKGDRIFYPPSNDTWVWKPEFDAFLEWCSETGAMFQVKESWEFVEEDRFDRPFDFIQELYVARAENKRKGNPAQYAQKLSMNSIYGKLAQQKGKNIESKAPAFHNLEYAGFITSFCRGMVWRAMSQDIDSIISVNTDGIYTTRPLDLDIGTRLGQWEYAEYDACLSVQCGMYFLMKRGEWSIGRTRGIASTAFPVQLALDTVNTLSDIHVTRTRFRGGKFAGQPDYRRWVTDAAVFKWGGNDGKRVHREENCPGCESHTPWHRTSLNRIGTVGGISRRHTLPWRDGVITPWVDENTIESAEYGTIGLSVAEAAPLIGGIA